MIRKIKDLVAAIYETRHELTISNYQRSEALIRSILRDEKYRHPKNLTRFSYKGYSQFGEDGIINEIFNRIGVTNKTFVEFGVGDGMENNTTFQLVVNNWRGFWIEGSSTFYQQICTAFATYISESRLGVKNSFITAENIEQLLGEMEVPEEIDLLSIDIDGNDYHVWSSIKRYRPRVVIVEYNGSFGSNAVKVMPYEATHIWDGTNFFGASLKAFENLGQEKGYSLVACDLAGINAFFVRNDLLGDAFQKPYSAGFHYEQPRYYLRYFGGHQPKISSTKKK